MATQPTNVHFRGKSGHQTLTLSCLLLTHLGRQKSPLRSAGWQTPTNGAVGVVLSLHSDVQPPQHVGDEFLRSGSPRDCL